MYRCSETTVPEAISFSLSAYVSSFSLCGSGPASFLILPIRPIQLFHHIFINLFCLDFTNSQIFKQNYSIHIQPLKPLFILMNISRSGENRFLTHPIFLLLVLKFRHFDDNSSNFKYLNPIGKLKYS